MRMAETQSRQRRWSTIKYSENVTTEPQSINPARWPPAVTVSPKTNRNAQ